jgi:hypothetical protein
MVDEFETLKGLVEEEVVVDMSKSSLWNVKDLVDMLIHMNKD